MKVLLTGGAGFIGSHTLVSALRANHQVMVFDDFSNSSSNTLERVKRLANRDFEIVEGDISGGRLLAALEAFRPNIVVHFAGLKAVGESHEKPIDYYQTNVAGSINLLRAMDRAGCRQIIFSSTATVYGQAQYLPFDEDHPIAPESPYAQSKVMVENIIRDWSRLGNGRGATILRYFNPVGAHDSGDIGEDPNDIPNNLMPYIQQVAIGRRPHLLVHGNDYDTVDGTGVRDYLHVVDLAEAHLAAIDFTARNRGFDIFNIGTGRGTSVLEMLRGFEAATGKTIPYVIGPRRAGDVAAMLADPQRAHRILGWRARFGLAEMCASAWNFQRRNPAGYTE